MLLSSAIEQLVYSTSEKNYNEIYEKISEKVSTPVLKYFDKNGNSIKSEWIYCIMNNINFNNATNNRLEAINRQLKATCGKYN